MAMATAPAAAQVAAALGLDSTDRYRGVGIGPAGPVLRGRLSADTPDGFYAALAAGWSVREAGWSEADGLVGLSRRLADPAQADPGWGWDLGVHRRGAAGPARTGTTELMAGLLGPGVAGRLWWSPDYEGQGWSTFYAALDADRLLQPRWQAFVHLGRLHFATQRTGYSPEGRPVDRTDARVGVRYGGDRWAAHLARDGLVAGSVYGTPGQRRPAWVLGADVAF